MLQSARRPITKELNVRICSPAGVYLRPNYFILYTESGNMLIMAYAYARASGDHGQISTYVRTTPLLLNTSDGST